MRAPRSLRLPARLLIGLALLAALAPRARAQDVLVLVVRHGGEDTSGIGVWLVDGTIRTPLGWTDASGRVRLPARMDRGTPFHLDVWECDGEREVHVVPERECTLCDVPAADPECGCRSWEGLEWGAADLVEIDLLAGTLLVRRLEPSGKYGERSVAAGVAFTRWPNFRAVALDQPDLDRGASRADRSDVGLGVSFEWRPRRIRHAGLLVFGAGGRFGSLDVDFRYQGGNPAGLVSGRGTVDWVAIDLYAGRDVPVGARAVLTPKIGWSWIHDSGEFVYVFTDRELAQRRTFSGGKLGLGGDLGVMLGDGPFCLAFGVWYATIFDDQDADEVLAGSVRAVVSF